ncbi:MAG: hypothetical protein ACOC22_01400 [bacterium]
MLSFKQKRRYKRLSIIHYVISWVSAISIVIIMVFALANLFESRELIRNNPNIFFMVVGGLGLTALTSHILSEYYQMRREIYLNKIKIYRLNRHFNLIVLALVQKKYDLALNMYNELIPDNTDQGTILYGAFLFALQQSKSPDHIKLSQQHTANVLNKFTYHDIFR